MKKKKWVVSTVMRKLMEPRLSLTFPVICHSRTILWLVTGASKREVLSHLLSPKKQGEIIYPAEQVKALDGQMTWLLDEAAGQGMKQEE